MAPCPWWLSGENMRRAVVVELTEDQRSRLESLVRAGGTPQRIVRRARVVLLASRGEQNNAIARRVGMTPSGVSRWRRRFVEEGVASLLKDRPGRGRRPTISAERVAKVVAMTIAELPPGRTPWSRSTMAKASGLSESTIGRIWRSHGLKPHRVETFKLSNDPRFAEKLRGHRRPVPEPTGECRGVFCGREQPDPGPGPNAAGVAAQEGTGGDDDA